MGTIVGTDGDDTLYGDGKSQINGGKGNDLIYPSGNVHQEVVLSPGNDTIDFKNGFGQEIIIPSNDPSTGFDTYINETTTPWLINGKTVPPRTILDPYGGVDRMLNSVSPELGINIIWGSNRNEFIKGNFVDFALTPYFGNDFAENVIVSFRGFNQAKISIPGTSGTLNIDSSILSFQNVSNWSFWDGGYDVSGSGASEGFNLWGDVGNYQKTTTISGGGGSDVFQVMSPTKWLIRDATSEDVIRLWSWFLTKGDEALSAKLRGYSSAQLRDLISLKQDLAEGVTNLTIKSLSVEQPATLKLIGLFDFDEVRLVGGDIDVKLARSPIVGDGKSTLKGTAADDLIHPYGGFGERIEFSGGNDQYILGKADPAQNWYHFRPPENTQNFDGFVANIGSQALTTRGITVPANSISDGVGGIDTIDYSSIRLPWHGLSFTSSSADDYIQAQSILGNGPTYVVLELHQGFGDDKFFNDGSRASAIVTFWYPVGDVPVDISIPEGSNKVLRVQEDTLEFDRVSQWDFNSGFFNVVGTLNGDFFKLNWNAEADSTLINTFRGGGGADRYWLNGTGANTRITDFAVEDKILIHPLFLTRNDGNLFDNTPLADLRPLVNLNFDPARYLTTITVKKLLDKEISTFLLDGYFSGFDVVKDSGLLSIRPSFTNVLSSFPGNALTSSVGKVGPWLVHDMTKPLSLTPYQDVIGFDASKVTSATKVTGFKSGADLLQLSASTAPAGAAISMNLESKQFVAGPGVKQPTAPDQYVLYDTNTGTVYFDQDGNGPSPTWAAMILEAGTALASSDIQISKPQVFRLEADRSLVDENGTLSVLIGSSNVAPNTEVSYSISGISSFDLSGVKLTGSVKLDGNGEALLKLPIAADGITEGTETLTLTLAGQTLSVPINDSSRAASADTVPPTLSAFAPADGAVGVAVNSNLAITFSEPISRGTGSITLKTAAGATVESFGPTSNRITVSGSTLTIDPTKSLDIYSRYMLDLGAGAVQDQAGNASVASNQYDFRTETTDGLYHFFVVAFGAAPGVTYMGQLAEATHAGLSLQDIVEIFTTKSQFTSVYPTTLTNKELATKLVENIVKASASEATKVSAAADIEAALGLGWSRGKVIYTVFGNLASKPPTDTVWGGTAKQFANQVAVARHFTETLEGDTTNVGRLQAVLGNVTKDSDVSSTTKLSQLLAQPSFVVSADKASVNEGSVAMFSISSYGLAAGSSVSYALSGTNLTGADVVGGSLAGSVTLDSSGSGFISVQFADDKTTEGNENLNLLLQGNVVKTITVLDTSTLPIATDTIAPTLIGSNYLSGSKDVPINANFFFTFSETIKKGNGTVQLLGANGALIEAFNVQTSSRLTWSGTQLTLDPSIDLANGETYRLVIPPGAIDDQAGNGFAGVSVEITTVGDATPPPPPPGF